jgi:hypothetical protein
MSVVLCCVGRVYFIILGPVVYGACCAVCVLLQPEDAHRAIICFTDQMYILCTLNIVIVVIVIIQFNAIQCYLLCTLVFSIIVTLIIKAWYSKFQFIICFSRVIGFLNKSSP